MAQFPVLYPDAAVLRTALRVAAAYGLSWFDAHPWAFDARKAWGERWGRPPAARNRLRRA